MSFLHYIDYAKDYVSGLCNELCEAIVTKLYPDSAQGQDTDIAFVYPKARGGNGHSSERPKDDVRKLNEQLCQECAYLAEEYKRLRGVLEQLSREYEESKDLDSIRRYGLLKGMIKRSFLHLKLTNEDHNQVQTGGKQKEEMRKREEHLEGLTKEDITQENDDLQEQIKQYRRKLSMMRDLIEEMERSYESSKRYIVVQRYRLMKNMIKNVIHNKWI